MITVYPKETLGTADFGWLKARYHFSFGAYHNPHRMGFGDIRVINDDAIAPHQGFGTHGHRDMEIITYVRSGAVTHQDSLGHSGRIVAGQVQVMSAGTGIRHSEHNHEDGVTRLYQIWIMPKIQGLAPRWDMKSFPTDPVGDVLPLLVSGFGEEGALTIHQDATIHGGRINKGDGLTHPLWKEGHGAYVLVASGEILINQTPIKEGDGAEITGETALVFEALTDAEILVIGV
jgi:redox-sensitive bicupin YhaK (pirin superfamily)